MIKIKRTSTPRYLALTNKAFKKDIQGMTVSEAYTYYKRNRNRYEYNTEETKRFFKKMNNSRCSFCTRYLTEFDSEMTVEHIKTKHAFPSYIFQWTNLLCSCRTCNTQRSTRPHDKTMYLDPTKIENIGEYFSFDADGTISENPSLDVGCQSKAKYMIRLYKLDRKGLECERRHFIKEILEDEEYFKILKSKDKDSQAITYLDVFTYYSERSIE